MNYSQMLNEAQAAAKEWCVQDKEAFVNGYLAGAMRMKFFCEVPIHRVSMTSLCRSLCKFDGHNPEDRWMDYQHQAQLFIDMFNEAGANIETEE